MTYAPLSFTGRAPALLLATAILGCSGGDLALPQPDAVVHLAVVGGDQQTGTVGEPLPKPLIVELRDEQGQAVVGREVVFVATNGPAVAMLSPDTAVTDADGEAVGQWVLGTTPGVYSAEARLIATGDNAPPDIDLPAVQFTASAEPARPDTLRAMSRLTQPGRAGREVEEPPVVRVADRYGNPVGGVAVHWEITSGSGTVSAPVVVTGADGLATVTWTLGRTGVHNLTARVDGGVTGSPVVFTAVAFF